MPHAYVTYFDINYAVKGIAMIDSLLAHDPGSSIRVVCLDDDTFRLLAKLGSSYEGIIPVRLRNIENDDRGLAQAKGNRSKVEYYWTLTPAIMLRFLESMPHGEVLVYVDGDLLFFSSPDVVFEELGGSSVLIHGHNFPRCYAHFTVNGIYNVGLVSIRNDEDGLKVARWWRDRCLEWCYNRCEDGKMGDQKYLESFATLTDRLVVSGNPGIGVAPWNYMGYRLSQEGGTPCVNGQPTVFFHYHSAAYLAPGCLVPCTDLSYPLSKKILKLYALPYMKALDAAFNKIRNVSPKFAAGFKTGDLTSDMCVIAREDMGGLLREDYPCIISLEKGYIACGCAQFPEGIKECGPVIQAGGLSWTGDYADWQSAGAFAEGYDGRQIFAKAMEAARAVRDGKALWERDTVLFNQEEWNWHVLAALFKIAALEGGKLHVLDFGGAFGSTFMQNRRAFNGLSECSWHVVEQEHFVAAGKREFSSSQVHFHTTIEETLASVPINVILLSSVLQYLAEPYKLLKKAANTGLPVIIDRTPLMADMDRITIQHVPESIYKASYPCWWLNKERIRTILTSAGYRLSPWFQSSVDPKGFLGVFAEPEKKKKTVDMSRLEVLPRHLRILQVDDFYPGYLDAFYTVHPEICGKSSGEQAAALAQDGFSAIHAVVPYLSKERFDTEYLVCQAMPMQKAWAREHNQPFPGGSDWQAALVRRRIEIFKPDVAYFADPVKFDGHFLDTLSFKPRLVMGWRAADVPFNWNLSGYGIMLSGLQKLLDFAERQGAKRGILFKPGMPRWLADAVAGTPRAVDVCFAGSISPTQHATRFEMLDFIAKAAQKHGFSLALHLNCDPHLATPAMKPYLKKPVFGLEMQKTLAAAKIVLDDRANHGIILPNGSKKIDLAGKDTINMRMFEATGSGSFLLTRDISGVRKYFEPSKEIDVWKDQNELERKILYWLAHEREREEIAQAGKKRCLVEHGMDKAVRHFEELIWQQIKR